MSIYDKASLVLIPSGTKTSKVYSQKPVNGDGDFTFSRSTAATRVNADGNIEKETQNLVLQSNSFSTTPWVLNNGATLTSGQAGYDGSSNAWLLTKPASGFTNVAQAMSTSGVVTFSIYAKAGTLSTFNLRMIGTDEDVLFDLSAGLVSTSTSGVIHSEITAISSGWYRCSFSAVWGSGAQLGIYAGDVPDSTAGNIYIQDAQLEQGLVARDYIETTTAAVEGGITDDVPRLDYTDSSCPALLLEPQRTNNILNSEYFGGYSFTNGSITTNNTTSPEGLTNASTFVESTALGTHQMRITTGVTSGSDVTFSFYAKANGRDYVNFWEDVTTGHQAYFNLSTGVATNNGFTSVGIEDAGNGWYRCYGTKSSFSGSSFGSRIHASQGANFNSYTGDGTSGFHIYGLQLEQDATYPTSYIPTYGSAVTRNIEDLGNILLPEFDDENNYSVMFELTRKGVSSAEIADFFEFRKTDFTKVVKLWVDAPSAQVRFRDDVQGSATMSTIPFAAGDTKKICVVCNGTTFKTFVDGALDETYNIVTPLSLSRFYMTAKSFDMKQLLVFKTSLTDQEAIDLTTL